MSERYEINTRGIIISRAGFGEGSVRVSLYTEERGLISAFAKSAREERSKLRPHLQVGGWGHFDLVEGAVGWRVIGATNTQNAFFLSPHKKKQFAVARLCALLHELVHGEEVNEPVFTHMYSFLSSLSHLPDAYVSYAEYVTAVRLLSGLGYATIPSALVNENDAPPFTKEYLEQAKISERELRRTIVVALQASGLSSHLFEKGYT